MPTTRTFSLHKRTAKSRRRRVSNATKVRFQKPSASNQKRQILRNARTLARHSRLLRANKVFTDYQQAGRLSLVGQQWFCIPLTDFSQWTSVLRSDTNSLEASKTFVQRIQLNMRYAMSPGASTGFLNVFIVTSRRNAVSRDFSATPPQQFTEFIENQGFPGANIRLNPALVKVHFSRNITLTVNTLGAAAAEGPAGNPYSTWKKGQITIPVRMNVRQYEGDVAGNGQPWTSMRFGDLAHYQKYWLFVYGVCSPLGEDSNLFIFYDQLATCINS